ncbi:endonuclease III [Candidatus Fermentibacteria bacterium]|nr:endonuclease III [Candidatus Fermentibacteria bacterium]
MADPSPPPPLEVLGEMRERLGELGVPEPVRSGRDPFRVLVSTVVSLRTRDAVTARVAPQVLDLAPDPGSMARVDPERLSKVLRPAGFYRRKAGQLIALAREVERRFEGRVPDDLEDLLSLPGVGRKTANYVLGMAFGVPSICVDVHVHRVSNRLGLVQTSTPERTEAALEELFPPRIWSSINHVMVRFGQRVCRPVGPLCGECSFGEWCPEASSAGGSGKEAN